MEVCKETLSNRQVAKKMKKAKAAIVASALSYLAFAIAVVCIILVMSAVDTKVDLELLLFAMGAVLFIASIVGVVCSSSALLKVKGEQLLEGKNLRYAKAGKVMSIVAICLCPLYVIAFLVLIAHLAVLIGEGFLAFIELFELLGELFGS